MSIGVFTTGFTEDEMAALGYLLYPYDVEVRRHRDDSDITICRGAHVSDLSKPLIRVRDGLDSKRGNLEPSSENGIVDLPLDLILASCEKFRRALNPRISLIYKMSTSLPFRYNLVPSPIRNLLLRAREVDANLSRHFTNEIARKLLVKAFSDLDVELKRKNPPRLLVTHDIETKKGLGKALALKSVEESLDLRSIWFLPSHEYSIPRDIATDLADGSRIGSHDIRHDGKLIHIRSSDQLVARLKNSRLMLENVFEKEVTCFRSPLLQFSCKIAAALRGAGYKSDFSIPCWEPVHPTTMTGFGIESAQGFELDGIVEFPLTLFQDNVVLNVLQMNTREAVKFWMEQAKLIAQFDGDLVLLVHPEYSFSRELREYRELLCRLLELQVSRVAS
jgi:hypothetical protein